MRILTLTESRISISAPPSASAIMQSVWPIYAAQCIGEYLCCQSNIDSIAQSQLLYRGQSYIHECLRFCTHLRKNDKKNSQNRLKTYVILSIYISVVFYQSLDHISMSISRSPVHGSCFGLCKHGILLIVLVHWMRDDTSSLQHSPQQSCWRARLLPTSH